jgi:hypothetical protein
LGLANADRQVTRHVKQHCKKSKTCALGALALIMVLPARFLLVCLLCRFLIRIIASYGRIFAFGRNFTLPSRLQFSAKRTCDMFFEQ